MKTHFHISAFRALMLFSILAFVGYLFIPQLNIRLNPSKKQSSIHISYSWQGASPENIDRRLTSLIENAVTGLEGIKNITARSHNGSGAIEIEPDRYADIDRLRFEIAAKIRQIRSKLPQAATYPQISLNKPDEDNRNNFLIYSVFADEKGYLIKNNIKEHLLVPLKQLKAIDKIDIAGATDLEYVIHYNPDLLKGYHLKTEDIIHAINRAYTPKGLGVYKDKKTAVSIIAKMKNTKNWHIPVGKNNSKIIYLDDIARIDLQEQKPDYYYRVNGKNAVNIIFTPVTSANTIQLAHQIDKILHKARKNLPANYQIQKAYDSTAFLNKELNKIYKRTLWVLAILLIFILLVTFSFRYLFITIISIIVNIGIAILLYHIFDIQIQIYSLAGITISFGLMIDNTIIMLDHLLLHRNRRIFLPVLASTLTTIGALLSIFLLSPDIRFNLIDFALVIVINLSVSLVIALWLVPALTNLIKPQKKQWYLWNKWQEYFYKYYQLVLVFLLRYKRIVILLFILAFGIPAFMLPNHLDGKNYWVKIYNSTIGSTWYNETARPYVDKYLGGSLRLFSNYVFENSFYHQNEETKLNVLASMEKGADIQQMNEVMLQLEDYLRQYPQIKQFVTKVYSGQYAFMEITFFNQKGSFPYVLKSKLIGKALDWGGMNWDIYGVGQGFTNNNNASVSVNFMVEAQSYNLAALNRWVDSLKTSLKQHPRIDKVKVSSRSYPTSSPKMQYVLDVNESLLSVNNTNIKEVYGSLKNKTLSLYPATYITKDNHLYPLRLEAIKQNTYDIWHIMNEPVVINDKMLWLKTFARVNKEKAPELIVKKNQNYIKYLHILYVGSQKFGKKVIDKKLTKINAQVPLGITFKLKERQWFFAKQKENWLLMLAFIIFIIFLISAVLFESYRLALIVVGIIPISFIGVFLTFYLFDFNFDQGGMASFVLLSGITVNAIFYLLYRYNQLKIKHLPIDAFIQSYKELIFPISLTILSTVLGFVPFVINGQNEVFWFALGVGTIGGIIFSFLALFIFMPLLVLKNNVTH